MSQVAIESGAPTREASETNALRFPLLLRATHWLNAVSFVGLVVSGVGILLAHPRFYWGETGGRRNPVAVRPPAPVHARRPIGVGTIHALSVGVAVRADGSALRHLGCDIRALHQELVAGEGPVRLERAEVGRREAPPI